MSGWKFEHVETPSRNVRRRLYSSGKEETFQNASRWLNGADCADEHDMVLSSSQNYNYNLKSPTADSWELQGDICWDWSSLSGIQVSFVLIGDWLLHCTLCTSFRCKSCREEDKASYKGRSGVAFSYPWASTDKNGDLRVLCLRIDCVNYKKSIADDPYVKLSLKIQHGEGNEWLLLMLCHQ